MQPSNRLQSIFLLIVWYWTKCVLSVGFQGFHYKGMEEPSWVGSRTLFVKMIYQNLDHFNHRCNKTWPMRYYEEDKYFDGNGPIFIMVGGEWSISPGFLQSGLMHDLAKLHKGLMFYTEHRYYGQSRPTDDLSSENMQYLTVDQALADVAYFIDYIKTTRKFRNNNPVIVHGGSYAGSMAAWMKLKYPHLIKGAVASSAPVYVKADFHEFYDNIASTLLKVDPRCYESVKRAFTEARSYLDTPRGRLRLKRMFNLCEIPDSRDEREVAYFYNFLTEAFAGNVQYNRVNPDGTSTIKRTCSFMTSNKKYKTPLERLSRFYVPSQGCSENYKSFVRNLRKNDYGNSLRQWTFQTCSQLGFFQTTNSTDSIFGQHAFTVDYFDKLCRDLFGEYYGSTLLNREIKKTNLFFGGKHPELRNVIFVNGEVDPWHSLSVVDDLNESVTAILIPGASHCQDLTISAQEIPELKLARDKINGIVTSWLLSV